MFSAIYYHSSPQNTRTRLFYPPGGNTSSLTSQFFISILCPPLYLVKRSSHSRFVDFVNKVLKFYNVPQMIKFRIDWGTSTFQEHHDILVFWISFAIFRNVRELDINVSYLDNTMLPRELFFCNMLSTLKLQCQFYLKLPSSAYLPCLKTLHLTSVKFDSSAERILSVCPVLEDLILLRCKLEDVDVLDISHATLKELWIEECHDYVLVLNAPSLLRFVFLNSRINGIISEIVPTLLVMARIRPESYFGPENYNNFNVNYVTMMLVDVASHARYLYLSKSSLEAFQDSYQALPTFCNLTRLEVVHVSSTVPQLLLHILNRSIHLEVLIFSTGFSKEVANDTGLSSFGNVPSCVSQNLTKIVVKEFSVKENESKLVDYFLKNAKVLDKMIIQVHSMEEKYAFSKKFSTFSKFSSDSRIVIEGCK